MQKQLGKEKEMVIKQGVRKYEKYKICGNLRDRNCGGLIYKIQVLQYYWLSQKIRIISAKYAKNFNLHTLNSSGKFIFFDQRPFFSFFNKKI